MYRSAKPTNRVRLSTPPPFVIKMKNLYGKLAKYYDYIYFDKDYRHEAAVINNILKKYKVKTVLDVACGTGNHAKYLHKKYKITGLDLNKNMIDIAKKKVRGVKFILGDMKTFKLPQKFDAIMCMFTSISYNIDKKQLKKTLNNFYNHLNRGGIILFDTGATKERYNKIHRLMDDVKYFENKNLTVVRISKDIGYRNKIRASFSYLIRDGRRFYYMRDLHILGMFSKKQIKNVMHGIGFNVKTYNNLSKTNKNRILFVGVKK